MSNINNNIKNSNERNINNLHYIKLRPIKVKKRQISSNLFLKNDSHLKKFLIKTNKRKNTFSQENSNNQEEFYKYTEQLENSMNKYQMSYSKDDFSEDNYDKYTNKKDRLIIKKVHDLNNSYDKRIISPKNSNFNIKIEINDMDYPNPIKSLGIIRNNRHVYNELNKNILSRQSESFTKQIEEIEHNNSKFNKKMPKIHITDLLFKDSLNIPLNKIPKKNINLNLPALQKKGKRDIKLFAYYKYPIKNYPEGREQFSISLKNSDIIISGGISTNMKYLSIYSLNLLKIEWEKINQNLQIDNRYGHTALTLNNKLYIFGGKTKYSTTSVLNGLEVFSFNNNTYSSNFLNGDSPENRRNHIAIFIGAQMFIHGGINENGKVLNDSYLLNIHQFKWNKCIIDKYCHWPKLYGHACSLVIPLRTLFNPKFNIYSFAQNEAIKKKTIKETGLFIFGGKSKEDGGLSNQLWILILGKKPLEWIKPETKGKIPAPRFFHTMNYYERGNYLIIHGGRNDIISENSALNDTYLLNLENFEWIEVILYSNAINFMAPGRYGHQSIIFIDKLIILGGMNNSNYLGFSLFIINLDFNDYSILDRNEEIEENKQKNYKEENNINKFGKIRKNLKLPKII